MSECKCRIAKALTEFMGFKVCCINCLMLECLDEKARDDFYAEVDRNGDRELVMSMLEESFLNSLGGGENLVLEKDKYFIFEVD